MPEVAVPNVSAVVRVPPADESFVESRPVWEELRSLVLSGVHRSLGRQGVLRDDLTMKRTSSARHRRMRKWIFIADSAMGLAVKIATLAWLMHRLV